MKFSLIVTAALFALAAPAFADGDVKKGEKEFKKCKSCHEVVADDGTAIVKGGKTGPNLYGVMGRVIGSMDFKYGESMKAAGENGLVWDADNFVTYVADPKAFLAEVTGHTDAKSNMSFKLGKGVDDTAAFLASVAPEAAPAAN